MSSEQKRSQSGADPNQHQNRGQTRKQELTRKLELT